MRMVDLIVKKRDTIELSQAEIDFFVQGYSKGEIPDYQASALMMAIQLNGMSDRETTDLTLAMVASGDTNPSRLGRLVDLLGLYKRQHFLGRTSGSRILNELAARMEAEEGVVMAGE